mgnify:CR=1 FL=1
MLKYYTNTVILGRQAYCENSGVSTSIVAEQNTSSECLQRNSSILDKSGVYHLREDAQSKQERGNEGTRSEVGPTWKGANLVSYPLKLQRH